MLGAAAALAVCAALLPSRAISGDPGVVVSFEMPPIVSAVAVEDGLVIRSNTNWELTGTVRAAQGVVDTIHARGGATGATGTRVVEGGLIDYTLVPITGK